VVTLETFMRRSGACFCEQFSFLVQSRVPQVREAGVPGKRSLLGWEANPGLFSA
jgi:hypothetical protein